MDKILAVARRDFLATVRTKAFVLSVLLMPAIIVGSIYGTQWAQSLAKEEKVPVRKIAVIDATDEVYPDLVTQFARWNTDRPNQPFEIEHLSSKTDLAELREKVRRGELYGYLAIAEDAVEGDGGCELARRDSQLETGRRLEGMIQEAVVAARMRRENIPVLLLAHLRRDVPVRNIDAGTGKSVAGQEVARFLTPFAFMFLLFMATFGVSQGLLTSLIEEKSSRVIELLLSAVSPTQLIAGKILGTVAVGFLLLAVWGGVGLATARHYHLGEMVTPYRLALMGLYFLPGFLLMAALLAGIGAACNELRDAQSMVFPLSIMTIIPMLFWYYIVENPGTVPSLVLSFIPPITPFVMILRVCADPNTPIWQIVATLAVLWVAVFLAIRAAGKVFRIGVLMYGKPPSLLELARWLRYS